MSAQASEEDRRLAVNGLGALADFAVGLEFDSMPPDVVARARHVLLNNVACAFLGLENERLAGIALMSSLFGSGDEAVVLGTDARAATPMAALLSATRINGTELSEGVSKAVVHPGSVIVPAVLAEGQRLGVDGRTLLTALVAGYEVLIRIGWTLAHDPAAALDTVQAQSLHRGWYPPALLGGYGVAAAIARLHGADAAALVEAFGIVGNLSPTTTLAAFRSGADIKPMGCGWASALGITAVRLAERGITGDRQILAELFPLLVTPVDFTRLDADLGRTWEIMSLDVKFVAAGPVLCEVECSIQMRESMSWRVEDITRIDVDVNARTLLLDDRRPSTPSAAKFSAPYCIAQGLLGATRADFIADAFKPATISDPRWHQLADKVHMTLDEEFDRAFESNPPAYRPTRITLSLRDGSTIVHRIEGALGLPAFPPSEADFVRKFRFIARRRFAEAQVEHQIRELLEIDSAADVAKIAELLSG
jgi:2-methylcitrate dehydratase PrpD